MDKVISLDDFAGMKDTSFRLMTMLYLTADDLKDPVHYARFERVVDYLHNMENWDVLVRRITKGKNYDSLVLLDEYVQLQNEKSSLASQVEEIDMKRSELAESIDRGGEGAKEFLELDSAKSDITKRLELVNENIELYERT